MKKSVLFLFFIVTFLLVWLAGAWFTPHHAVLNSKNRVIVTGSSTLAPLVSEIARRFERLHSTLRVDVQAGGSSRGIADVRQGLAHIGMVSRALDSDELDLLGFQIALDGVGLIVHQDNPARSLSQREVVRIYRGEIANWKEVNGRDETITVVSKAEGRATLEVFKEYFQLESEDIRADVIIGHNEHAIKTVAGNSGAIAYVSIGTAEYDIAHGSAIRLLALGGVEASYENVQNGTFPLSRPLNLVCFQQPHGAVKTFIEFARSAEVHDLIRGQGFISISE